ncbi:unnamed protein product [Mytilus edulis]|uniref:Uncharacterized protein n=1 Tax=Mytilus edulis TaxID=6550 RepID=A0A8S3RS86_MYTED|nr:unnamed protein product [Mytilus edulis]
MKEVTSLLFLQNVMLICSWSLDDVCDADDIKCKNPQILTPGEITYGQCYRHAALRRLLKVSFLTCLKECMKTSTCSNVSYRRDWKMCDINGNINSEMELVQEHGCFSSNISSWSKKLVACATQSCAEGYRCAVKGEEITCEIAWNRLRKMLIHVGENLDTSNTELCGQFIGPAVSGQVIITPCNTLPKGHLVKLTSVNTVPTVFHLTEVEVYGVE